MSGRMIFVAYSRSDPRKHIELRINSEGFLFTVMDATGNPNLSPLSVTLSQGDAALMAIVLQKEMNMEPNYNEMLDATRRKLAESGYQETGPGMISPAPAERFDVTETLIDPEYSTLPKLNVPHIGQEGADLLPLQVRETAFLKFWRSNPAMGIEDVAYNFAGLEKQHADLVKFPYVGRVSHRYPDGTENFLKRFLLEEC